MLIQLAYPALSLEHWHFASPIFSMVQKACTGLTLKNFAVLVLVIGKKRKRSHKELLAHALEVSPLFATQSLRRSWSLQRHKGTALSPCTPSRHGSSPLRRLEYVTERTGLEGRLSCRLSTSYGCDHWFQLLFRIGLKFRFLSFVSCSIPIASVQNRFV